MFFGCSTFSASVRAASGDAYRWQTWRRESPIVQIDCDTITDWDSFHDTFATVCDFPGYYGRNMNAWIDCVSDRDGPFVLQLDGAASLRERCADIYAAVVECSSFINWRTVESGGDPLVFLSFAD